MTPKNKKKGSAQTGQGRPVAPDVTHTLRPDTKTDLTPMTQAQHIETDWKTAEPEELREQPDEIEEADVPEEDQPYSFKEYGRPDDEDREDPTIGRGKSKLRPALEFYILDGKVCFQVKGDTGRMDAQARKFAAGQLSQLRIIGEVIATKFNIFLSGKAPKPSPLLIQQDFVANYGQRKITKPVLSNLVSIRSVELPDGSIMPLRSFFSEKHGVTEIPAIDAKRRLDFANAYIKTHPGAKATEICAAYFAANKHTGESKNVTGSKKDIEKVRKWFQNNIKKG